LQIEQGWNVVTADGSLIGRVVQVAGDKQDDIFDGLAVQSDQSARHWSATCLASMSLRSFPAK
jgi:hypothetical protein